MRLRKEGRFHFLEKETLILGDGKMPTSNTITIRKIRPVVEEIVEQKLIELLGDPDAGLKLSPSAEERLKNTLASKSKSILAEKVAKELGLKL